MKTESPLVCVLCGRLWEGCKNRCECGGFCTWGPANGAEPSSWIKTEQGYVPRPVPRFTRLVYWLKNWCRKKETKNEI